MQPRIVLSWAKVAALAAVLFPFLLPIAGLAQEKHASTDASSDPVLRAMEAELARSKAQLKMDNIGAPFYIEYRVFDVDQFEASAAYGAPQDQNRTRLRVLRVVVRLGDYKADSFFGPAQGVSNILPLDGVEFAPPHRISLSTDHTDNHPP